MRVTARTKSVQKSVTWLNGFGTSRDPRVTGPGVASGGVSNDRRHRLGALGERVAAEHLIRRGFRILERNYRTRWGELDIVAFDGRTLAFCEVKTRRVGYRAGTPFDAIDPRKCARVRKIVGSWLHERRDRPWVSEIRCDAIGVTFDAADRLVALEHLEGAF